MSFQQQQSNDGWQTVRSSGGRRWNEESKPVGSSGQGQRPVFGRRNEESGGIRRSDAPAAFGGGNERADQRRQEAEARAAFQAAEAREKRQAEDTEAKRQAEATNFSSQVSYPSLGSASSAATRSTMNYKQVVKEMIAKETEAQLAAAAAAEEDAYMEVTTFREPTRRPGAAFSRQRILDELEDDYSGPEEDDDEDGELNADIGTSRRRGDKGIW